MRKALSASLASVLLACAGCVHAQPTFENIYLGSGADQLIELGSHNILTRITRQNGTSILDPQGSIIQSHSHKIDSLLSIIAVRRYADNEFFFVSGYQKDTCATLGPFTIPYTRPAIGKMDSLGNILALRHYELNAATCWQLAVDLEITTDKSVVTWGGGGSGIQWSFFALKADSAGTPLWAKHFNNHGSFQFIRVLPSGDLLAGINMDTAGAVVARLDSQGNFLWCKSYIRPKGMVQDVVIEDDDSFIITGYTDSTNTSMFVPLPSAFQPKLFMMKLDGDGEIQWCRGYDSAPNHWNTPKGCRIVRALDGNYALLGTLGYPGFNMFFRPFLMKTDQSGDTLWTSSVGRLNFDHYAVDLLAYSDGGYIFDGIVWGDLPGSVSGAPYLFKTDSLGHFPCWERHHPVDVMDLFPTDSSFALVSVDGATVHPAFVSDTTYAPIVIYDGCTFTTGVPSMVSRYGKPRVYPNPNTGRFTVEFADPLMAESYYSVYDALGKLLYQRPLPTGSTFEEIDLSNYGRGTYVIKFINADGVCHERVVLE